MRRRKDSDAFKGEDVLTSKGKKKKKRPCINVDFSGIAEDLDGSALGGHNAITESGIPEEIAEIAEIAEIPIPVVFPLQEAILANHTTEIVPVPSSAKGGKEYTIQTVSGDKVVSKAWHQAAVEKLFSVTPAGVSSSSLGAKGPRKEVRSTVKIDRRDKITGEVTEKYLNQRPGTWKYQSIARKKEKAKEQRFAEVDEWDQYIIESFVHGDSIDHTQRWLESRRERPHLEYVTDEGALHEWDELNGDLSSHPWMVKNRKGFVTDVNKLTADDTICLVSLIKIVFIKPYSILMQEVLNGASSPSPSVNGDTEEEEQ
jgi:hypothetical protein